MEGKKNRKINMYYLPYNLVWKLHTNAKSDYINKQPNISYQLQDNVQKFRNINIIFCYWYWFDIKEIKIPIDTNFVLNSGTCLTITLTYSFFLVKKIVIVQVFIIHHYSTNIFTVIMFLIFYFHVT